MASEWNKLKYDDCNFREIMEISTKPGMYNSFLPRFENTLGTWKDTLPCECGMEKRLGCSLCEYNKDANLDNSIQELHSNLLDIDSDLKLYTRPGSKCNSTKYVSPNLNCAENINDCKSNSVVVTPLLCDRKIVPTNMKMPKSSYLKNAVENHQPSKCN